MSSQWIDELIAAHPPAVDGETAIRSAARRVIAEARRYGLSGPPFDPHVLASLLNIKTRPDRLLPGIDAMIVPDQNGSLTIVWDDRLPRKRTNFSVAHEIGHTLFPSCATMVQYRRDDTGFKALETLCDIAAAELLMPVGDFQTDVYRCGVSLQTVQRLSARYQASAEAIAIRMQYCCREPIGMFVAGRTGPARRLGVHYAFLNPTFRAAHPALELASGTWVPLNSVAHGALRAPLRAPMTRQSESWGASEAFRIEAMSLGSAAGSPPRVLALLRPV